MKVPYLATAFLLFGMLTSVVYAEKSVARLIPDHQQYQPFLLQPWKPGKPALIALKDPFCPYCIQALKRRSQLINYNVFVFWTPILGEQSVARVREFFKCASPVAPQVIDATVNIRRPVCNGPFNDKLFALNQRILDSYAPNSVPQYWMGGGQVALASLKLERPTVDVAAIAASARLRINWPRYQSMALNVPLTQRYSIALMLPEGYLLNPEMIRKIKQNRRFNWYMGGAAIDSEDLYAEFLCRSPDGQCNEGTLADYRYSEEEFRLLNGIKKITRPTFILEGKILTEREAAHLMPADIRKLFLSTNLPGQ